VRLATTNADRERIDELANLYSLVVSLNYLERAYVRDSITAAQCAPSPPLLSSALNPVLTSPRCGGHLSPGTPQPAPGSSPSTRPSSNSSATPYPASTPSCKSTA